MLIPPLNLAYRKQAFLTPVTLFSLHHSTSSLFVCAQLSHIFFHFLKPTSKPRKMEISSFQPYSWDMFYNSYMFLPYYHIPENYVHWRETPESHVYSANLPGVRKNDIKVEVEDSRYMIIRTEAADNSAASPRRFMRKFRLPERVDVDGISAGYEDGVLTVTVPRRGFSIDPANLHERQLQVTASAA